MIKVGVLFQETETQNMDLSMPEKGNPGVGGTAFCFLLFLKFLSVAKGSDEIDINVYQFQENKLPAINTKIVKTMKDALNEAKADGCEIVLLRNHQTDEDYEIIWKYDFKYIFWMHNKLTYREIQMFSKNDSCKRVIAVSREMYDYYIDDNVISKLDYVLNPFIPPSEKYIRTGECPQNVTFVGSLTYDKNFHLITQIWMDVLREVPNAKLHVIGSGRLYDKNSCLGRFGQAEESYEEMFMKPILDESGNPHKSVVFHGVMGDEKYEVFKETSVGIINPMATETFGLAAVEMESCGVPVVSRRKNGVLDAVISGKTGILYDDISKLKDTLVLLLNDRALNEKMGAEATSFARNEFLPERIMPQWVRIIAEVHNDIKAKYKAPKHNMDNNGKRIRKFIHGIHRVPFLRWVPSIHDIQKK